MWKKRLFYTFLSIFCIAVLIAAAGIARFYIRRAVLNSAAQKISAEFFNGKVPAVDFERRTLQFDAKDAEILRSMHLEGKVIFTFPVKFFELPWHANLGSIAVDGVRWDLNLQQKTLNQQQWNDFFNNLLKHKNISAYGKNNKLPDLITYGALKLTNPEGRTRVLPIRSILKSGKENALLGVYAGDMKVNFLYNFKTEKLVGQYQAQQSDFEFFRLSFGLPELFTMHGVQKLSGQFRYNVPDGKIDYIRGASKFGMNSSIQGSIFSLYGSRDGMISWEYLNKENWHIELRNATSGKPFRTKLHYLVLSQNTMEQNALSFDGEIEFFPGTFSDSFGLELDFRTSSIRHRLVGKWNMNDKSWELSRIDTKKQVPQVKLKLNDFNIAFQGRSFKLSGSGAQADHFGFHYELEMANADWQDRNGNAVITSRAKLEGDCILSLSDDTLRPAAHGKVSCELADGAFNNTRFMLKNAFLTFSPDRNGRNKYLFTVGNFTVGIPDLKNGVRLEIPMLEGEYSQNKFHAGAMSMHLKYKDIVDLTSRGAWSLERQKYDDSLLFKTNELHGTISGESFAMQKISSNINERAFNLKCRTKAEKLRFGKDKFTAKAIEMNVDGERSVKGIFSLKKIEINPLRWKFNSNFLRCASPRSTFSIDFYKDGSWCEWDFKGGNAVMHYGKEKYQLPDLRLHEDNRTRDSIGRFSFNSRNCRMDLNYTRKKGSKELVLSSGFAEWNSDFFNALSGSVNVFEKDKLFSAKLNYGEYKRPDSRWLHGSLNGQLTHQKGFELTGFSGIAANELTQIRYAGKNFRGENEFEVKNFPAVYIEKTLHLPEGSLSGLADGKVVISKGEFFNPFKIQTFYLTNNKVARLRLGKLQKYAQIGNSIEDRFASDALKDFFAKSLTLDYHRVGEYMVLDVKALGKSTDLLPYEYDVKEKKLKKSDVALFNSEVEVIMKYMIK